MTVPSALQNLKAKFLTESYFILVLVSGRPGPFRAEQISDWTALGAVRNDPGHFRAGPRVARTILGHPGSNLIRDLLGPKSPGPARDQHYILHSKISSLFIQKNNIIVSTQDYGN